MRTRRGWAALGAAMLFGASGAASGAVNCWLDFTSLGLRLDDLVSTTAVSGSNMGAGWTPAAPGINFTAAELTTIRTRVRDVMAAPYAGVPGITASFTVGARPGANAATDEEFTFQLNAPNVGEGPYGDADQIDWRNQKKNDRGRIYVPEFDLVFKSINENPAWNRAQKIDALATALGQTAAHEFGHNIGLKHRDCYGTVNQNDYANTGGVQTSFIMSSGSSGLGDNLTRTNVRTFNWLERSKLAFADGLANAPVMTQTDGAGNANYDTATPITLQTLPTSGRQGATVVGSLADGVQDWFSFSANAGDTMVADMFATELEAARLADPINPVLALFYLDTSGGGPGSLQSIFVNDDFKFSGNTVFGGPANAENSLDSFMLNINLPSTGMYFLQVSKSVPGGANYEMFVTVPAPGAAVAFVFMGLAIRRRSR